ncbi:MAG: DUF2339 domain-containing protein [Pseudomonadales bacterium]|nr:DUF2339 domain-containing protein [Pseudomonadales bacterium]
MEGFFVILALGIILGSLFGWITLLQSSKLKAQIKNLGFQVERLSKEIAAMQTGDAADTQLLARSRQSERTSNPVPDPQSQTATSEPERTNSVVAPAQSSKPEANTWRAPEDEIKPDQSSASAPTDPPSTAIADHLRINWMVWLGGISVGLSGVFLVSYSIEQGLLGPTARIVLGLIFGVVLHGVAEFGRQRSIGNYQSLAALAGGASLILYSALVAALLLYELFPPLLVFIALAAISLATMYLAILHGPVLAVLGILGGYLVPLLVDTGSNNIVGLFMYSSIISISAVWLMRTVYREWIWFSVLVGALGWWLIAIALNDGAGIRGYYLAFLGYIFVAIPAWDWLFKKTDQEINGLYQKGSESIMNSFGISPLSYSLYALAIASFLTIYAEASAELARYQWLPITVLFLLTAGKRDSLRLLPLFLLLGTFASWLLLGLESNDGLQLVGLQTSQSSSFIIYAAIMAFVYFTLALRNSSFANMQEYWFALGILTPLGWIAVCYLLITDLSVSIAWGATSVTIGVVYLAVAAWKLGFIFAKPKAEIDSKVSKFVSRQNAIWLIIAGHFAYSLAVAIMVREAGLTLALAAQVLSLAWVIQRFQAEHLDLLLKIVIAVIVTRLTLNPWMLTYPDTVHWSLWTFGGSTLFCTAATFLLKDNEGLRKWLEAAALHLFVLTVWSEIRYWLYDGDVFAQEFSLLEMTLNMILWSSLVLVYNYRKQVSNSLKQYYAIAAKVMLGLALFAYLTILFPLNPVFGVEQISERPIINLMLLSYGFPILISYLIYKYYEAEYRTYAAALCGFAGFVFVTLQIRHLWQGTVELNLPTGNGELYTYSIVWLILAMACLLGGSIRYGAAVYRAGFGLLMLVIAKIFLVDMSDLEGLLRVASFMGLGLSLLGLAYLYQRFNLKPDAN